MRFLIIQNDPYSPAGIVGERMAARGWQPVVVHPLHGGALPPSPAGFAGAVILGGVMSANDDDKYPALVTMRRLLGEFHEADKPLLGLCLGAQILARCFGKPVKPSRALELGYVPIAVTEAGRDDPLLRGLEPRQNLMQFHEETFEIPAEGVHLMTGEVCVNQAFRVGRATYGFQCHFEATPELVDLWLDVGRHNIERHLGEAAGPAIAGVRSSSQANGPAQRRFAEAVADRWLDQAAAPSLTLPHFVEEGTPPRPSNHRNLLPHKVGEG